MISQIQSATVGSLYQESSKGVVKAATLPKEGEMSKVEQIRSEIEKGEYRIDLQALAEKMAEGLM